MPQSYGPGHVLKQPEGNNGMPLESACEGHDHGTARAGRNDAI